MNSVFKYYFDLIKVQFFWEGHKNLRHPLYGFDIYLVNVKTIRRMAQIFESFSEKLNFKVLQRTPARLSYTDISTYCATIQTLDCATFHITYLLWRDKNGLWQPLQGLSYCFNLIWRPRRPFKNNFYVIMKILYIFEVWTLEFHQPYFKKVS